MACNANPNCRREKKVCAFGKCKTISWDDPQCLWDREQCRDWRRRCALQSGIAAVEGTACGVCIAGGGTFACAIPCGKAGYSIHNVVEACRA